VCDSAQGQHANVQAGLTARRISPGSGSPTGGQASSREVFTAVATARQQQAPKRPARPSKLQHTDAASAETEQQPKARLQANESDPSPGLDLIWRQHPDPPSDSPATSTQAPCRETYESRRPLTRTRSVTAWHRESRCLNRIARSRAARRGHGQQAKEPQSCAQRWRIKAQHTTWAGET